MFVLGQSMGWEDQGVLGLCMLALITAFGYFYRDNAARHREIDQRHSKEREAWQVVSRAERADIMAIHSKAWEESRQDTRTYLCDSTAATRSLENAVRDLHVEIKASRASGVPRKHA